MENQAPVQQEQPVTEKQYVISGALLENVLAYLSHQPYRESAMYIQALSRLPEAK